MDDTIDSRASALTDEERDAATVRRWRRHVSIAGLIVVAIAVLALIPPLVNINRYQRRIVQSISASLGRPVHLDQVSVRVLPFPALVLQNFVVSEDPAFGAEPTIRANTVEVRLRLSSLWRRDIEFGQIHFEEPSLNLVRNAEGRWNLDNVLVHASRIDAAPTAQRTAGATPRFPYIEATGGRVNIKLGDEKIPFSLTDANFALWLPTAQQWRVRLEARPARTDSNIADPGVMRLEGTLTHAGRLEEVPVDLTASWHDAPLGEASRLLTGDDRNWRGTVHADASVRGLLGQAQVKARITLDELRRADFVPAHALDVTVDCEASANAALAQLDNAVCRLPGTDGAGALTVRSTQMLLQAPASAPLQFDAQQVPLANVFAWLRLLSPRVPPQGDPAGTVSLHLARDPAHTWSGNAQMELPAATPAAPATAPRAGQAVGVLAAQAAARTTVLNFAVGAPRAADPNMPGECRQALLLQPTEVALPGDGPLTLSAGVSTCGYWMHGVGRFTAADLAPATGLLPGLADDLPPALSATAAPVVARDLICTRLWGGEQTCVAGTPAAAVKRASSPHRR